MNTHPLSFEANTFDLNKLINSHTNTLPSHIRAYVAAGGDIDEVHPLFGMTPLIYFIKNRPSLNNVITIVRLGADIEKRYTQKGYTPLIIALQRAHLREKEYYEICKFLIKAGANVNATNTTDSRNKSILMSCMEDVYGMKALQLLLDAKVNLDAECSLGMTALQCAIEKSTTISKERLNMILALISAGANVNCPRGERSPLIESLNGKHPKKLIQALIIAGTDINAECIQNITVLMTAFAIKKDIKFIRGLIKEGANIHAVDMSNKTVLMYAISGDYPSSLIQELILAGANVDAMNSDGYTALMNAIYRASSNPIIDLLIRHSKNVNARNIYNNTAFMCICEKAHKYSRLTCFIYTLIRLGAEINARNTSGRTVLMKAINSRINIKIIEDLIKAGANLNVKTHEGHNAIMYAWQIASPYKFTVNQEYGYAIIRLLVQKGADINQVLRDNDDDKTILDIIPTCSSTTSTLTTEDKDMRAFLLRHGAKTYKQLQKKNKT